MGDKSSYLRFLPPVLWQAEPGPPEFSLGAALRIFEKILTGIDDGVVVQHPAEDGTPRTYEPVEHVIARLHRLFDPWTTPPELLPWLASWVSLEFPEIWDQYQRRKVTSEIVQIYRKRGLKRGLDEYLDLYTVAEKRPRVAVDDGARLLFSQPSAERLASIDSLIAHGPMQRRDGSLAHGGMVRPHCIALAPDGSLIVGDAGTPTYWSPNVDEAVWAIPAPGRYQFAGAPPQPVPLGPSPWDPGNPGAPVFPRAVAVDDQAPWRVYVLDGVVNGAETALYQLSSPSFSPVAKLATKQQLGTINPVAMAFDKANGNLLVLDRGTGPNTANPPKVIDVQVQPFLRTDHIMAQVLEPLSLLVLANGDLIIGDCREQNAPTPGDLVRVDRTNPLNWVESRLLAAVPAGGNPLVAPTGVAEGAGNRVLVLDSGVKPIVPNVADPFNCEIAEPAALYWVDLNQAPPVVQRASETKSLVGPRGMVFDGQTAFICDPGQPETVGLQPRVSRALAHEFAVIVHFSKQRSTTVPERRRIVGNIREIVDGGKPAHTLWTVVSSV